MHVMFARNKCVSGKSISLISGIWVPEKKKQLSMSTVRAMVVINNYFEMYCLEFYNFLTNKEGLLLTFVDGKISIIFLFIRDLLYYIKHYINH